VHSHGTFRVHLIRGSLEFCSWQDRKKVAGELKSIYQSPTMEAAAKALDEFAASEWGKKYPNIAPMWRRAWEQVIPFLAYPPEVRRVIYTTNALESVNMRLRKIIKNRGHFPNDDAAIKLLYLAIRNIVKDWTRNVPWECRRGNGDPR
jgi:putative transposase